MARPWSRKGREDGPDDDAPPELDDDADLDADEHAWWAQRDIADVWSPRTRPEPREAPQRDILAEHFGEDWRTSFGFDRTDDGPAAPPPDPAPEIDTSDPYAVLGVESSASWEEIVDARRREARRHHPDRLFGQSAAEMAAAEDRIRAINVAYQELRVRRGR